MIGFNHALTGIGIALSIRNPLLVASLALASHFLLDIVPHFHHKSYGDPLTRPYTRRFKQTLLLDIGITLTVTALSLFFWPEAIPVLLIGIFFAMLPDLLWPLYGKVKCLEKFFSFHLAIQKYERPWGAFIEGPFTALIVSLLFF